MAYEPYRRSRGNGESGYFEGRYSGDDSGSDFSGQPRDVRSLYRRDSTSRQRTSPLNYERMAASSERSEPAGADGVSPELIAAITEKVKRELLEHMKPTLGNIDDTPKPYPMQKQPSNRSNSSSPPPTTRRVCTPPSPNQSTRPAYNPSSNMDFSPSDKPSGVRFSEREPRARPTQDRLERTYSTVELSTIDQKWGRLFDSEGTATQRLGQFLRGLANHIVQEFEPKRSIVITPVKLATYYSSYGLEKEPHPLFSIFRAQSNEHISKLFRDLGCQHHLVQGDFWEAPLIPGLTPLGFAQWMTLTIMAYPEEESKRLSKAVLDLPIDADGQMVDGKPERLPKQISRHLLPDREDRESRKVFDKAITNFLEDPRSTSRSKLTIANSSLSRHSSTRTRPVEVHQKRAPSPTKAPPIERERKPYSSAPPEIANEEAIKIERDRQPYTAQPGNGKIHHDNSGIHSGSGVGRTESTSRTREQPESRHHRTQSSAIPSYVPPPSRNNRRTSSPPLRSFSQSTPIDIDAASNYGPPPSSSSSAFAGQQQSYSASSQDPGISTTFPPPPPIAIRDRSRRTRDDREYPVRGSEEDARIYTSEFNSPRDAERFDRYQESRTGDVQYERSTIPIDPTDGRGAPAEEWYREMARGPGYYGTRGGY